ncbi:hypothetical protein TCON_2166 [Astathelohania contejeani]|uniref:Uncharacterized protein n=1 Tax=Astathelohania contejeani TaxID=164912 RepID=A0ABQ7HWV0_9MICR|nr:hypothetical protein TCON_2166 [Thelohania contejeani]
MHTEEELLETLHGSIQALRTSLASPKRKEYLSDIYELLETNHSFAEQILKWNFLQIVPILLSDISCDTEIIRIIFYMLQAASQNFPLHSKLFQIFFCNSIHIFYFTERLSVSLKKKNNSNCALIILLFNTLFDNMSIQDLYPILKLLYQHGFFILINAFPAPETTQFYETLYKFKKNRTPLLFKEKKDSCNYEVYNTPYEIYRKQFDSEISFKTMDYINFKSYLTQYKEVDEMYYLIMMDILKTNFHLLPGNKIHLCNYIFSCENINKELYKQKTKSDDEKLNLTSLNSLYSVLSEESLGSILEFQSTEYIIYFRNIIRFSLLLDTTSLSIIIRKIFYDESIIPKILNCMNSKDIELSIQSVLLLSYINKCFIKYYKFNIELHTKKKKKEHILTLSQFYHQISNEKTIIKICRILAYDLSGINIDGNDNYAVFIILNLLQDLFVNTKKEYFYKPSVMILFKSIKNIFNHSFLNLYFKSIIEYLSKNPYNLGRILFPFSCKKEINKKTKKEEIKREDRIIEAVDVSDSKNEINNKEHKYKRKIIESDDKMENDNAFDSTELILNESDLSD